jgi:hypothetical protein
MTILGLAITNFAGEQRGKLPPIVDDQNPRSRGSTITPNWPIPLFPYLLHSDDPAELISNWGNARNPSSARFTLFLCAADPNNASRPYGLAYALNAGAGDWLAGGSKPVWTETWNGLTPGRNHFQDLDWNGDGKKDDADIEIGLSTGVFHRHYYDSAWPDPALRGTKMIANPITLDWITDRDGLATTLMLLENTNSRNWGYSDSTATSNGLTDTAICLSATVRGKNPHADVSFGGPKGPLEIVKTPKPLGMSWMNSNIGTASGRWPAPSSRRPRRIALPAHRPRGCGCALTPGSAVKRLPA